MIELDGLGSATESFSNETIMSPNLESNFPRLSISDDVSNYKVQPKNLLLKTKNIDHSNIKNKNIDLPHL